MNHFQFGAMMNEVAENVLVCVISYMGPFVFSKYKGITGLEGSCLFSFSRCQTGFQNSPFSELFFPLPPAMHENMGGF